MEIIGNRNLWPNHLQLVALSVNERGNMFKQQMLYLETEHFLSKSNVHAVKDCGISNSVTISII
jgi:hypothetical protein